MTMIETTRSMEDSSSVTKPIIKPVTKKNSFNNALMKLLPNRRRQSEEVKQTSFVLDDYANLLTRDSSFLSSAAGDAATVSSATMSLNESVHAASVMSSRPSVVSVATVGSFQRQEIALGSLLGKGRFSKVYEITSIELDPKADEAGVDACSLDVSERARTVMSKHARQGKYAMKRLRKKLLRRPRDFTRAAAHMVIEAQYLSKLDHPNILKLRGSALGGASSLETGNHDGYFLILDRVTETLQERIHKTWATQRSSGSELLYQKTHYALQLASAIQYLHDRRIIFRDLSPKNLGFTDDHSLQLFDFGMARELPQALGFPNELFHMTQNAGTKPYTATEVATTGLYNLKADVYSFSMVTYEILMEQIPMGHLAGKGKKPFATKEFIQAVYIDGERPSFEDQPVSAPPKELQDLLSKCWQVDMFRRPTMEDVYFELQAILETLPHESGLGGTPPGPRKVTNMVLETRQQQRLSLSDLSNGMSMTIDI